MYSPLLHKIEKKTKFSNFLNLKRLNSSIFSKLLFTFIMQRDLLQEAAYIFQHQIDNDTE